MGSALIPIAILGAGVASVLLIFAAYWKQAAARLDRIGDLYRREADIIGLNVPVETIGTVALGVALAVWFADIVLFRPPPLIAALSLGVLVSVVLFSIGFALKFLVRRTVRRFNDQFETVLRMLASAVRVGLGSRQALIQVGEQASDPARRELLRVVGLTAVGVPLVDAIDELAERMPLHEVRMMANVMRVQSRTGSDLGGVLEALADAIRERRRFRRKVAALTSQARATAWVLGCLPLAFAVYVAVTQPSLRDATFTTALGRLLMMIALGLDALAALVLVSMTRIDA